MHLNTATERSRDKIVHLEPLNLTSIQQTNSMWFKHNQKQFATARNALTSKGTTGTANSDFDDL